jgi:hypothetical protein
MNEHVEQIDNDKYYAEMNRDIAIAQGWKEGTYHDGDTVLHWMNPNGYTYDHTPQWSSYLGDAWHLVDEMAMQEHVSFENLTIPCLKDGGACAIKAWRVSVDDYSRTLEAVANEFPWAVCRVYLMWMADTRRSK